MDRQTDRQRDRYRYKIYNVMGYIVVNEYSYV